jgi:hypothetical protein
MIEKHNKQNATSKAKRFIMGDANVAKIHHINERLDSSLLDLQLALQVESSGREDKRSEQTAATTVEMLLSSVQERARETVLLCVQCQKEYRQSENAEGLCKYHPNFPIYSNWKYKVECCGKLKSDSQELVKGDDGCIRGLHSSIHHFDYPYTAIFLWMRDMMHNNVQEEYVRVEDVDYEDNIPKYAVFGRSKNNKLFVALGKGNFPLYLEYFSSEYPVTAPDPSEITGGNLWPIAKRGTDELPSVLDISEQVGFKWEVSASWLVDFKTNSVTGIRLSAKSLSSKVPLIKALSFQFDPFKVQKPVLVSSAPFAPHVTYTHPLPSCVSNFTPFPDAIFQEPPLEPEYETEIKGQLKLRLKKVGRVRANAETNGYQHDNFTWELMVLNLSQAAHLGSSSEERMVVLNMLKDGKVSVDEGIKLLGALDSSPHSEGPVTMIEFSARALLDGKWITPFEISVVPGGNEENRASSIPFSVPPRSAKTVVVMLRFSCPEKQNTNRNWFGSSYLARLGPMQLELTMEEMSGAKASIKAMFANPATDFTAKNPEALYWLEMDCVKSWERIHVAVLKGTKDNYSKEEPMFQFEIPSCRPSITCVNLQTWGYQAWKANEHIFKLESCCSGPVTTFGLVDMVNRMVCGFKFQIQRDESVQEGIWMIPDDVMQNGRKSAVDPLILESGQQQSPAAAPGWNKAATPASVTVTATSTSPTATTSSPQPTRAQHAVPVRAKPAAPAPATPTTSAPAVAKPAAPASPVVAKPAPTSAPASNGAAAAELIKAIAPPPLKTAPAPTPAPAANPRRAFKCGKCSFGAAKDECLKCKNRVGPSDPPANYCQFCHIANTNKCAKCGNMEPVVGNRTMASICNMKCAIGPARTNCVKCGKFAG